MAEIDVDLLNKEAKEAPDRMIMDAEESYRFRIGGLADYVTGHEKIKIILLAGPSGSGKTTTANLLKDAIVARGEDAMVVSLDDFYKDSGSPEYPMHSDGTPDYECPEALHLSFISDTLMKIANSESFTLPRYDFKEGRRVEERSYPAMPDGCVIIEGLHALNPKIYSGIPTDRILRLFVSVSTNINKGEERILSGRKLRFVRRMVRDSIYRGADAERTLSMWRGVLNAEDVYLYPYKETADLAFNTFHPFEPGVMRDRALSLIDDSLAKKDPYASIVLEAMKEIYPIDESRVPDNSLIREFIPGGIYEHLY